MSLTPAKLKPYEMPIEHSMPDPGTYTIVINERQRKRIAASLDAAVQAADDPETDDCQMDMVLADMFSDTDLAVSPGVNGFVL